MIQKHAATALFAGGAFSGLLFLPLYVAAFSDFGALGPSGAGLVATVQLCALALASLLVNILINRFSLRTISIVGGTILFLANLQMAWVHDVSLLFPVRALSGIGEGLMLGGLHILVLRSESPERSYASANFAVVAWGICLYPIAGASWFEDVPNVFLLASLLGLLAIGGSLFPGWFSTERQPESPIESKPSQGCLLTAMPTKLLLGGIAAFYVGEGALWAYVVEIGRNIGMSVTKIGQVLSVSFVLTLIGPVVAHFLKDRAGRALPVMISLVALSGIAFLLGHTKNHGTYTLGVCLFYLVFIFTVIYTTTLMASIDPSGRTGAFVPALRSFGTALGPFIASLVLSLEYGSFELLSRIVILFYAIAFVMIFSLTRSLSRKTT